MTRGQKFAASYFPKSDVNHSHRNMVNAKKLRIPKPALKTGAKESVDTVVDAILRPRFPMAVT